MAKRSAGPSASPSRSGRVRKQPVPGEQYLVRRPGSADWHIDITIQGHRLRRSSGTAQVALAAALALREYDALYRRVVLGERPEAESHLTLNDACVRYYQEVAQGTRYGEQAQKHQMATLIEILGARTVLADLDDARINDLVQALRRRRIVPHNAPQDAPSRRGEARYFSPATINRYLTTLSGICTRAREKWKVQVGDWKLGDHKQAEPEGREVFLSHDQARRLMDAVVPHARPILLLELVTGLRKANVHELVWERVSLDMGRLVLVQKGNRPLAVSLVPEAVRLLEAIEPDPAMRKGPVFRFGTPSAGCRCAACLSPAKRGQRIASTRRAFATATKAAGLGDLPMGKLRFHDLRHTFASWLLAAGVSLKGVSQALGHANIQTTMRYVHLTDEARAAGIARAVSGLLNAPQQPERTEEHERKKA